MWRWVAACVLVQTTGNAMAAVLGCLARHTHDNRCRDRIKSLAGNRARVQLASFFAGRAHPMHKAHATKPKTLDPQTNKAVAQCVRYVPGTTTPAFRTPARARAVLIHSDNRTQRRAGRVRQADISGGQ